MICKASFSRGEMRPSPRTGQPGVVQAGLSTHVSIKLRTSQKWQVDGNQPLVPLPFREKRSGTMTIAEDATGSGKKAELFSHSVHSAGWVLPGLRLPDSALPTT